MIEGQSINLGVLGGFGAEVIVREPLRTYTSYYFADGLRAEQQGDGMINLPGNDGVAIFDVSLGKTNGTYSYGKVSDGGAIEITEAFVAVTLREYLGANLRAGLSAREVAELCAKFLEERVIQVKKGVDLALSFTVCQQITNSPGVILAGFGSNRVYGQWGKIPIDSQKAYDPWVSRETSAVTKKLEIRELQINKGPILMATDGFLPGVLDRFSMGRKGYPLKELSGSESFFGEALLVRVA